MVVPLQAATDPKTELNIFSQRYCQRPMTQADISYRTRKFGNQYQSIVKLDCIQGQEYAGQLCVKQKEAEKSAAKQAVMAMANLHPPTSKDPKKKTKRLSPNGLAAKKAKQAKDLFSASSRRISCSAGAVVRAGAGARSQAKAAASSAASAPCCTPHRGAPQCPRARSEEDVAGERGGTRRQRHLPQIRSDGSAVCFWKPQVGIVNFRLQSTTWQMVSAVAPF
ncbi:unnamed protein product [Effrenium voratum]|nr:unnamed protein product [Effrenium voratum]